MQAWNPSYCPRKMWVGWILEARSWRRCVVRFTLRRPPPAELARTSSYCPLWSLYGPRHLKGTTTEYKNDYISATFLSWRSRTRTRGCSSKRRRSDFFRVKARGTVHQFIFCSLPFQNFKAEWNWEVVKTLGAAQKTTNLSPNVRTRVLSCTTCPAHHSFATDFSSTSTSSFSVGEWLVFPTFEMKPERRTSTKTTNLSWGVWTRVFSCTESHSSSTFPSDSIYHLSGRPRYTRHESSSLVCHGQSWGPCYCQAYFKMSFATPSTSSLLAIGESPLFLTFKTKSEPRKLATLKKRKILARLKLRTRILSCTTHTLVTSRSDTATSTCCSRVMTLLSSGKSEIGHSSSVSSVALCCLDCSS